MSHLNATDLTVGCYWYCYESLADCNTVYCISSIRRYQFVIAWCDTVTARAGAAEAVPYGVAPPDADMPRSSLGSVLGSANPGALDFDTGSPRVPSLKAVYNKSRER